MTDRVRYSLRGVTAGYGARDVLRGVDLTLARGTVVALLGENGSGKTTLLKLLAGLLSPRAGEVLLDSRPLSRWPRDEAARRIGYLPQAFEPFFPATAVELTLLGRTPHLGRLGAPGEADRRAALAALAEADATLLSPRDVRELSGGERQRVYLARVLALEPEILLLDEPTANLDPRHRFLVVEVARRRASLGALVVLSTHELDVAAAAADAAVLLRDGSVLAAGGIRETLTSPLLSRLFDVTACVTEGADGRPLVSLARLGAG